MAFTYLISKLPQPRLNRAAHSRREKDCRQRIADLLINSHGHMAGFFAVTALLGLFANQV